MENSGKDARPAGADPAKEKGKRLLIVAGPCMLESPELGSRVAGKLKAECEARGFDYIFKASFDKANRTSIKSERGPGLERGIEWLSGIRRDIGVRVTTDIHEAWQAEPVSEAADMLQIPAFLCRQTDLLVAASKTGKPINVKKAQFLAPEDMASVVEKCRESGASEVMLCERGTSFGYHRLVVDFRSLLVMRALGCPVMFDATHSVQSPGGLGAATGGDRRFVLPLACAALAIGVDALFMEVHPDPGNAKSDGPNMVPLGKIEWLLDQIKEADALSRDRLGFATLGW